MFPYIIYKILYKIKYTAVFEKCNRGNERNRFLRRKKLFRVFFRLF